MRLFQFILCFLVLVLSLDVFADKNTFSTPYWKQKTPAAAFDGNDATFWQGVTVPCWIMKKFKTPRTISQIVTKFNGRHLVNAEIEIIKAGATKSFRVASKKDINGKWIVNFDPVRVKAVKTIITRCSWKHTPETSGEWPYIFEQTFSNRAHSESVISESLPICTVPVLKTTELKIDGVLDDSQWKQAGVLGAFSWEKQLVKQQTVVRLLAANDCLYIGAIMYEKNMNKIRANQKQDGFGTWADDCLDIFIAPAKNPTRYSQITINSLGSKYYASKNTVAKNPRISIATKRYKGYWTIEAKIPFKDCGLKSLAKLKEFRMNFGRNEIPNSELSSWSALSGGFHKPNQFGYIFLSRDSDIYGCGIQKIEIDSQFTVKADVLSNSGMQVTAETNKLKKELSLKDNNYSLNFKKLPASYKLILESKDKVINRSAEIIFKSEAKVAKLIKAKELIGELEEKGIGESSKPRFNKLKKQTSRLLAKPFFQFTEAEVEKLLTDISNLSFDCFAAKHNLDAAVTWAPAMLKVLPYQPWVEPLINMVTIDVVRGEFESAQILVSPRAHDIINVTVSIEQPLVANGKKFDGIISFYNVLNIPMKHGTGAGTLKGDIYPDPLVPAKGFDVKKDEKKAIWVEVETPRNIAPGDYSGKIKVKWSTGETLLALRVKVYPVTLPIKHSLKTPFVISPRNIEKAYGLKSNTPEFDAMIEKYRKYCTRNRLDWLYFDGPDSMQQTLYPKCVFNNGKFEWDFAEFDKKMTQYFAEGLNSFAIGFSWGRLPVIYNEDGTINKSLSHLAISALKKEDREAFNKAFVEYASHLKRKGWFDNAYYYVADEPKAEHYKTLKGQADCLLELVPDLKTMVTTMEPSLEKYFKIWCPNLAFYDEQMSENQQKKGKEVWWYVCIGRYHPNYYLDYKAIDPRMHFWLTYSNKITGVLYWRVNHWGKKPFEQATDFGDGYIFYPGKNGPLPSVRSMMIRDGIEDYDLLKLLEKRNKKSPLLNLNDFCESVTDYSQDYRDIEQRRLNIIKELSK